MFKHSILMGLLGASALAAVGCGGVSVVKVNAARVDATCKRVYFTSTIKQGDSYAEGVPTLVSTGPDVGVIPIGTNPTIDLAKPVLVTLKVDKAEPGCARFPVGGAWSFDGILPSATTNAAGASVYGLDFDKFAAPVVGRAEARAQLCRRALGDHRLFTRRARRSSPSSTAKS